jgi:hypothetical protein
MRAKNEAKQRGNDLTDDASRSLTPMRIFIPAHLLLAYSLTRRLQKRFAKDSAVALVRAVGSLSP